MRKIQIGTDIHCSQTAHHQTSLLDLIPDKPQLIFEGDSLTLSCRAPRIAMTSMRESEDSPDISKIFWGWSEKIVSEESSEDVTFHNPREKFPSVTINERPYSDSGILYSILKIPYITRNHSGLFDCTLISLHANLSRSLAVHVISDKTQYCPAQETTDNKGYFYWPKTIRSNVVKLACAIEGVGGSFATRKCNEFGVWEAIDSSNCPYVHETTRILEQFAKVNLSLARGSVLESARRLKTYTSSLYDENGLEKFKDPIDLVYIGKTIQNYLKFVHTEKELGSIIIDLVSNLLKFPKHLLEQAQYLDNACRKLVDAVESAASYTTSSDSQKSNLAIEVFNIPNEAAGMAVGILCSWIKIEGNRVFQCNTASKMGLAFYEKNIEASIQFPATQYTNSHSHRLLVSVYQNTKLFPQSRVQGNYQVTSSIIGAKILMPSSMGSIMPKNLSDPIYIVLRGAPFHDDISLPKPVYWDFDLNETGGWSLNGCQSLHYSHGMLMFSCNRLGFYGLVQHTKALNDFPDSPEAGARFRYSPIGFYFGALVLFSTMWLMIVTYIFHFNEIMMGRRVKHSLINTWISISLLVFMFAIGIYQTENHKICQFFGISIHYLSLSVLLWICVSVSNMYKRISRNDRISGIEDDLPSREDQRIKKSVLGLYFVGYGIPSLICGINSAVNIKEYASYTHCFMDTSSELGALFLPASILLFFLLIMFICIRFHLRNRVICNTHLSEGTEAMEIDLLESNNTVNVNVNARSVRSLSTQPTNSSTDDLESSPRTQLKSYIIVLVLYLFTWISAGIAISIPFNERVIYEEEIFSIAFALFATFLGCFITFFYGLSRSDVRGVWSRFNKCNNDNNKQFIMTKENGKMSSSATATVLYHQPMNLSRTNSQNSRTRPLSVGSIRVKASTMELDIPASASDVKSNFMLTMQRHQASIYGEDTCSVEMFYNPSQSNAARRFFKKQRKLQKLNNINIDMIKRNDFNDASSDISSTIMSYSKPVSVMLGTSSKVNNTNIHVDENKTKMKHFSNSNIMSDSCNESELLNDICQEGFRISTLKSKINNIEANTANNFTNLLIDKTINDEKQKNSTIEKTCNINNNNNNNNKTPEVIDGPVYMNTRSIMGNTIEGRKMFIYVVIFDF